MHRYRFLHARPGLYYPTRRERIDLVVIHSTEGPTAAGAARWFTNPAAGGSAHLVVDDSEVWRCVHDHETAFGAYRHNSNGLHLELAGFARWTTTDWLAHQPMLQEAARIVAGWMRHYEIPFRQATLASDGKMRGGWHGHVGLPGNDHHDPGRGFPWPHFLRLVEGYLENRPARADSLQVVLTPPGGKRRVWSGWQEAFPAVRWIAKRGIKPGTRAAIAWRGALWRGARDVERVAKHLARKFGGGR